MGEVLPLAVGVADEAATGTADEAAVGPSVQEVSEPVLQWKFAPGQTYSFNIERSTSTERDVAGNKVVESAVQRCQILWEIIAVESEVSVQMKYAEIEIEMGLPTGKIVISTNPNVPSIGSGPAGELSKLLLQKIKPLVDQPILLNFNVDGQLSKVELSEELEAHLQQNAQTRSLRDLVTREGIGQILGSFLTPLPSRDSRNWTQQATYDVAAGVPLTQTTRYERAESPNAEGILPIKFTSELSFPEQFLIGPTRPNDPTASTAKDPNPPRSDAPPPFNFDPISNKWPRIALQDTSGQIDFDIAAGYVRSASGKSTLVTEKAYSDALIKITMITQTKLTVERR